MADRIVFAEKVLCKLPEYLSWEYTAIIPCAGTTAWSVVKGVGIGKTVFTQGTGGVSMLALKLVAASGLKVILTPSSDDKVEEIKNETPDTSISEVNYRTNPHWYEDVLRLISGIGVDLVVENGGTYSQIKIRKCTCCGGTISQVGYLAK